MTGLLEGSGHPICQDARRGLDHGAYVPLMEMYPRADIPVLQMSMPTLDPQSLLDLGRRLAPLRDEGVLIVGSGFSTHNLAAVDMRRPSGDPAPNWSIEFDDWLARSLSAGEIDALIDFQRKAPAADIAHPRTEHFAPLFAALGATMGDMEGNHTAIEGFWYGLSKRSIQFN